MRMRSSRHHDWWRDALSTATRPLVIVKLMSISDDSSGNNRYGYKLT
jgi:hypothetical protein